MTLALKVLHQVLDGELAFDRTLKVNPNPKPDDDPKIVETLDKQFLAKRARERAHDREPDRARRATYRPLLTDELQGQARSEVMAEVQRLRQKLVILIGATSRSRR